MITPLFITSYVGLGGGETALLTLAENLDPDRFAAPQLLIPHEGQLGERWRSHNEQAVGQGGDWRVHIHPFRGASTYFVPGLWARFPIVRHIERIIHERGVTLIHSDYHSLPYALPAARRAGIACVWTCWGWWFQPKPWQRAFFRRPNATIAASWAIREGFLGQPPFMPPDRVMVIPPGVDTMRFRPGVDGSAVRAEAGIAPDAPVVALIARFQDVKGHDVFQAMARRAAAAMPEVRFLVAGENVHGVSADDAYKRRILAAHAADPVLRERLVYLGFRPDAERVIAAADVVVCSSQFESYGMVNVEAMSSGKPVVSTRRGGPSETIRDGETGFLVDAGDDAALAARVVALLHDPAARAAMGSAGRAHVLAHFSAQAMGRAFGQAVEPFR